MALVTRFTAAQIKALNRISPVQGLGDMLASLYQAGPIKRWAWDTAPVAASTTNVRAALTLLAAAQPGITTGFTNPDVARNIQVVVTLAGADLAGNIVLYGTDINGNPIDETIALTSAATYQSLKAFKTVTAADFPARTTAADAISLGVGPKLGLPDVFVKDDTIISYTLNGVATAVTSAPITKSTSEVAKNLIVPASAPDASRVYRIRYIQEPD